jgi:diguanylate cyclase (GGDEF)-like protein
MSLRLKVTLLSASLVACLILVLAGVLWMVVRPTFRDIEDLNARERMDTVVAALTGEAQAMRRLARDWASWDDTYAYALTRDPAYEVSNLVPSTFTDGELHFFAILDPQGRTLWSKTMDESLEETLPDGLDAALGGLPANHPLMETLIRAGGVTGLIASPQGPLLASAHPILTSEDGGPARGVLIMGRRLDYIISNHLAQYSGIPVELHLPGDGGKGVQADLARRLLAGPATVDLIEGLGGSTSEVTLAHRLDDLSGAALGALTLTLPKRVEPLGRDAMGLALLVASGGGLAIVAAFWLATRRSILAPLARLERHIAEISRTGDLDSPLDLERTDEIGSLARAFDTMRGRIRFLVHHDPLTGLANRDLFLTLAQRSLTLARRNGALVAIACLDIDRFKTINDSLGHANGDILLTLVAKRLEGLTNEGDLIARHGGDEFLLLLTGLETPLSARCMASRLIGAFAQPFAIGDRAIYATASLGLGLFPRDDEDLSTLVGHANAAMNHAKALGRNNYQFFDGEVNSRAREILTMEGSLRQALVENRLELRYQPQVDASTDRLVGMEALVRWNHPSRGLVTAEEFLPFVEQSGLHATLDRWVMETACRQARAWRDMGLDMPPLAVNLSARHFEAEDLHDFITETLARTGADPRDIALEITETVMMRTTPATKDLLARLRAMGFQVVIDDFGTGFASLSYLREFPLDKIKIDKTFVAELPDNQGDKAILRAVLALARELDLDVLAEGVERSDQADWLTLAGCPHQQGYLHGQPLPADQFVTRMGVLAPGWNREGTRTGSGRG